MQTILISELIEKFDAELVKLGYAQKSLKNYRIFWKQIFKYFLSRQKQYFCKKIAQDFLEDRYHFSEGLSTRPLSRNETHIRQMVRKLVYFQEHGSVGRMNGVAERHIATKEFLSVLQAYVEYCCHKGYASSTRVRLRLSSVKFFSYLEEHAICECSQIAERTVIEYINSLKNYTYRSIGLLLGELRILFTFCHDEQFLKRDLSEVLPNQQHRESSRIPTVWSREDVLKLLLTIDRGNPCGKRDYAILLLVALLGIRAGDVRSLKLANIKWNTNRIEFVQSKTTVPITLPLLKDIGWAIIDYLKNGRPKSNSPFVFLRHIPPFDKVHERNGFYHIVKRCIRLSHVIPPASRNTGLHSLRHTLASTLLSEHVPLSTIAGVLGHSSMESTAVYLRTDLEELRKCTIEEPEAFQ